MKPDLRYKLLKYTLIIFSVARLCIGTMMALLAIDHITNASDQSPGYPSGSEPENQTAEYVNQQRPPTSFDIVMNGTDKRPANPVYPEAALIASVSIIVLSLIGLIGLLKDHIVWIVTFGLLSILFLILRVHVLLRTLVADTCGPGEGCVRDELLNTIIGVIEIIIIFRLAYELRLKRDSGARREDENAFPDLRTSIPTVMNVSGGEDKNQTDVEEFETSLALKKQPGEVPDGDTDERRRSSTRSFLNYTHPGGKWS